MADIELRGALTLPDLVQRASAMLGDLHARSFADAAALYALLAERGGLTLRDAVLDLTLPHQERHHFLALHRLRLINSTVYLNTGQLLVVVNELECRDASIRAFPADAAFAPSGRPGRAPGRPGEAGARGLAAGSCRFFVTDRLVASSPLEVVLSGQHGGNGGDGAPGHPGAPGAAGRVCRSGPPDSLSPKPCGDGGAGSSGHAGGDGGDGGEGGAGGDVELRLYGPRPVPDSLFRFHGAGGQGGYPGQPGRGGDGGEGGAPGSVACPRCHAVGRPGPRGDIGLNGRPGRSGAAGAAGEARTGGFSLPLLRQALVGFLPWAHEGLVLDECLDVGSGLSEALREGGTEGRP